MHDSDPDSLLRLTAPKVDFPPSFRRSVWSRIEAAQAAPRWWSSVADRLAGAWRPVPLAASAAVVVAAGAWLGRATVPSPPDRLTEYVQSVSPLTAHRTPAP